MADDPGAFRRQMAATLVGAVIGLASTGFVTIFNARAASQTSARAERLAAIGEYVSALYGELPAQAKILDMASRSGYMVGRVSEVAALQGKPGEDEAERELIKESWALEETYHRMIAEVAEQDRQLAAAYYRLQLADLDAPPPAYFANAVGVERWQVHSYPLTLNDLQQMAGGYQKMSDNDLSAAKNRADWMAATDASLKALTKATRENLKSS